MTSASYRRKGSARDFCKVISLRQRDKSSRSGRRYAGRQGGGTLEGRAPLGAERAARAFVPPREAIVRTWLITQAIVAARQAVHWLRSLARSSEQGVP